MASKKQIINELIEKLTEFKENMEEWHDEDLSIAEELTYQLIEELEQNFK